MTIRTTSRTYVKVECDNCDLAAPEGDTNQDAIQNALKNNFYRLTWWNGTCYSVGFYCNQCAPKAIEDIKANPNRSSLRITYPESEE